MKNRIFALTLALMFIAAALGVALSVTLRNRANDGAEKAQALRAQAEDLETNGETGIWAIDAEKQKVYEKQDALAVEIKDLERQIKDDEDSIARDKQNIDELAGLYDQLDAAVLRTEVWQAAAEILKADPAALQNVAAVIGAVDTGIIPPEEALEQLQAMKPDENRAETPTE